MATSVYVHIPFCAHKCDFCDFAAFQGADNLIPIYFETLWQETEGRAHGGDKGGPLQTIFFGGGTPGYVNPSYIARTTATLDKLWGISPCAEITLETTPQVITAESLAGWQESRINRLSIGIQSLNDTELTALGRDHTAAEALSGLELAISTGSFALSCDLMYGLPGQTLKSWGETLAEILSFRLDHLSAYGLMLEPGTPLYRRLPREKGNCADEEIFAQMYGLLRSRAFQSGLRQYEISNFARPGFESAHNINYWKNRKYQGFGVSAHRYLNGVRSSNWKSLKRYLADPTGNETFEIIDDDTRLAEGIFLGLRMVSGVNLAEFAALYGFELTDRFAPTIARLEAAGLIEVEDGHMRLAADSYLVSNSVMTEFI